MIMEKLLRFKLLWLECSLVYLFKTMNVYADVTEVLKY